MKRKALRIALDFAEPAGRSWNFFKVKLFIESSLFKY